MHSGMFTLTWCDGNCDVCGCLHHAALSGNTAECYDADDAAPKSEMACNF